MGEFFGTDGIRGVANKELTPELAFRLGKAAGYVLLKNQCKEQKSQYENAQHNKVSIVIGKDSRISSDMLECALAAGFMSVGVSVIKVGLIPTPGVSFLVPHFQAMGGAMISASHNPYPDNGIKLFNQSGLKLTETIEREIEQYLLDEKLFSQLPAPTHGEIGRLEYDHQAVDVYGEHLKATITNSFSGLKIVLDCANGSASMLAPKIFTELGAEIVCISNAPDGININVECGSTHVENLQKLVIDYQADLGLAFDGDADRLIAVDQHGNVIDGDYILTVCGTDLKERGKLVDNTIVTTVMANMGFFVAMNELKIHTAQTKVGDKYVLEEMLAKGYTLGGEQSGHIIFLEHAKTGDGILTGLQVSDIIARKKQPLHILCEPMKKYPQLLLNVRVVDKEALHSNIAIKQEIENNERKLGSDGRILVRPSGTEPLVRVMAEGPDEQILHEIVNGIVDVIKSELA